MSTEDGLLIPTPNGEKTEIETVGEANESKSAEVLLIPALNEEKTGMKFVDEMNEEKERKEARSHNRKRRSTLLPMEANNKKRQLLNLNKNTHSI